MSPPSVNRRPSRLQLLATFGIISAAINAFFNGPVVYTCTVVTLAIILSLVAWRISEKNLEEVATFLEIAQSREALHQEVEP